MADYIKALAVSDLEDGSMKTVTLTGKNIAVARVGNDYYAVDDRCSHDNCSFGSEGFLDGSTIICGCHGAQFDATNGHVLSLPATQPVRAYEVKVEDNTILIRI